MNNSNDTRDLPACSAVPQPTAPPRAPIHERFFFKYYSEFSDNCVHLLVSVMEIKSFS